MLNRRVECEWLVATDGVVAGMQPKVCAVTHRVSGVVSGGCFLPQPGGAVAPAVDVVEASGKVVHVPLTAVRTLDGEAVSQDALAEWHDAEWMARLRRHGYDVPEDRVARLRLAAHLLWRSR